MQEKLQQFLELAELEDGEYFAPWEVTADNKLTALANLYALVGAIAKTITEPELEEPEEYETVTALEQVQDLITALVAVL